MFGTNCSTFLLTTAIPRGRLLQFICNPLLNVVQLHLARQPEIAQM